MSTATVDPKLEREVAEVFARRWDPAPDLGLYPDVSFPTYLRWDAASNSRLTLLKKSPGHLHHDMESPAAETEAQILGRATHAAVLEPDDFEGQYARGPMGDRRTKAVREEWNDLEREFGIGSVLKPAAFDQCLGMRDSVWSHTAASALLDDQGEVELSGVWDHETGVRCKLRADKRSLELDACVDLKTTVDASKRAFERAIYNFGYYRQGALYVDGLCTLGAPVRRYVIIAVEKTPPYAVAVYRLSEGALLHGIEELEPLLERYRDCSLSDEWAGYPEHVQDIALPDYAWRQIKEDLNK